METKMLVDHLFTPEFVRFYLVFIHILGSTVAVGTFVFSYIEFLYFGYLRRPIVLLEHTVVKIGLIILILSGFGIVYIDTGFITSIDQLLTYKKLTLKLIAVSIILINSLMISYFILPKIMSSTEFSRKITLIFGASAGLSSAAWISAIFMGKAKVLVPFLDYKTFLIIYMGYLAVSMIIGMISSLFIQLKVKP